MSDQVTHTPTPWVMGAGFDGLLTINAKVSGRNLRVLELCGNLKNPEVVADAEFTLLAVNAHDALTARVAELEAENERLRELLDSARVYVEEACRRSSRAIAATTVDSDADAFEAEFADDDQELLTSIDAALTKPEA